MVLKLQYKNRMICCNGIFGRQSFFGPSLGLGEGVQTKLINIYTLLTVDNYKVYNIYEIIKHSKYKLPTTGTLRKLKY